MVVSQWDCWGPRAPQQAAQAARCPGRLRCALGLLCCSVLGADAYSPCVPEHGLDDHTREEITLVE